MLIFTIYNASKFSYFSISPKFLHSYYCNSNSNRYCPTQEKERVVTIVYLGHSCWEDSPSFQVQISATPLPSSYSSTIFAAHLCVRTHTMGCKRGFSSLKSSLTMDQFRDSIKAVVKRDKPQMEKSLRGS